MNLYYLNPFNLIKEVFFPTYAYFKEFQKRPDYSSQNLEGFKIFSEKGSKKSERISPEALRPTNEGKRNIEDKIKGIRKQHTPGGDFPWEKPVK